MDFLINSGFFALFIAFLIGSISYATNNIDATPLEKKMMTNFGKIKIYSSIAFVFSFVLIIILFLVLIINGEIDEIPRFALFLTLVILLIAVFVLAFLYIVLTDVLFSKYKGKKFDFLITLDGSSDWEVIRMTESKYLLIKSQDSEEYRLIKDYGNLSIKVIEKTKSK